MAEFYGVQTGNAASDSNNDQGNQNLPEMRRQDLFRRAGRALPQMCAEKCAWQFPGRGCSRGRLVRRSRTRRSICEGRLQRHDDRASASKHITTRRERC